MSEKIVELKTKVGLSDLSDEQAEEFARAVLEEVLIMVIPQGQTAADRTMINYFHNNLMNHFGIKIPFEPMKHIKK